MAGDVVPVTATPGNGCAKILNDPFFCRTVAMLQIDESMSSGRAACA